MPTATFRFYADLNDFLPPPLRGRSFDHLFRGRASIKDMVEALGAPHPEIELLLVNGEPVDFSYIVRGGDRISVYPFFRGLDVPATVSLRPEPPAIYRFVLDTHLGRLAAYLRLLGFDTRYRNDFSDERLAEISAREGRILLTRDRGLLKRSIVQYGYCPRQTDPKKQIVEIVRRYNLAEQADPFSRCVNCNGLLEPTSKAAILDRLDAETRRYYDDFSICRACGQIYWQGSHFERMRTFVDKVLEQKVRP